MTTSEERQDARIDRLNARMDTRIDGLYHMVMVIGLAVTAIAIGGAIVFLALRV